MDAIECIKSRRSVRRFKDEPVKEEDIRTILECAFMAPSGNNRQPWEFFVTRDKEKLKGLSDACTYGKFIKNACFCIVVTGNTSVTSHVVEDCSAATENALLAAHALGYGGCWIAGWNRSYEKDVFEVMGIKDENLHLVSLIAIGVPETSDAKRFKRGFECVHFV
jgi:nitroreductase